MTTRLINTDRISSEELAVMAQDVPEPDAGLEQSADGGVAIAGYTMEGAGWTQVWDTRTGERSVVNRNGLFRLLDKSRRPDGSRVFTTDNRGLPTPKRGTLPCLLNAEHPEREYHDTLGLPECRKFLRTTLDVRRHMQNRHKSEWESIQEDRRLKTEEEERLVRSLTIRQLSASAASDPGYGAPAHIATRVVPVGTGENAVGRTGEPCPDCGETITAKPKGMHLARLNHRKKFHSTE